MSVRRDDKRNPDKITAVRIVKQVSEKTYYVQSIAPLANTDTTISLLDAASSAEKGTTLATATGTVTVNIQFHELFPEPVVINKPDGSRVEFNGYITYLTPHISETSRWINKDDTIATR